MILAYRKKTSEGWVHADVKVPDRAVVDANGQPDLKRFEQFFLLLDQHFRVSA